MTESSITSPDNPLYRRLRKLAESARARREARTTLLDGEHLCGAYLDAGGQPRTWVRAASFDADLFGQWVARTPRVKAVVLPDALFRALAPVATPAGLLCEADWLDPPPRPGDTPLVVALEAIQDPGNLGAMLRSAAAAGATRAILSRTCHDPWSPKALRGGQGAQFILPIEQDVDLSDWCARFDGDCLALALGDAESLYARKLTGPLAVVVGNEGSGLSEGVCTAATATVRIPMPGAVESLNASAALAVTLFEAVRQRAAAAR